MAKKTKDGLIMQGFRSLANRFSPEAEKYARYKIQKQRGTYDDKTPSYPEPIYRGPTEQEKKNIKKGFETPKDSKPASSKPKREKQSVASSITDAKIKKLDTSIKGENIKTKESSSSNEPKKQVGAKERRQLNRAANLAIRKGISLDEASALKEKRRTARKQYLRNFASQLARGEQAAPMTGFGEGEGNPNTNTSLAGASAEIAAKNKQQESDARDIFSSFTSIGNDNSSLLSNDIQPLGTFETEDSSPINYMQKEYRKKRGY